MTSSTADKLNALLNEHDFSIGLSNDEQNAGTWEYFDRKTKVSNGGYDTATEAYKAAVLYIQEHYGDTDLPSLNEDDELEEGFVSLESLKQSKFYSVNLEQRVVYDAPFDLAGECLKAWPDAYGPIKGSVLKVHPDYRGFRVGKAPAKQIRTKIITISACSQCPHYMFDYDNGDTKYYGQSVCWFGQEVAANAHPRILKDENAIPADCPLP